MTGRSVVHSEAGGRLRMCCLLHDLQVKLWAYKASVTPTKGLAMMRLDPGQTEQMLGPVDVTWNGCHLQSSAASKVLQYSWSQ
ncbi:mCG1049943 [Mus musculus]|nr:mCG1049943 [Mus musculus]